jgi:hypothetical protein
MEALRTLEGAEDRWVAVADDSMDEMSSSSAGGAEMQEPNMWRNQAREYWYITSMLASSASTKYNTAPLLATCRTNKKTFI